MRKQQEENKKISAALDSNIESLKQLQIQDRQRKRKLMLEEARKDLEDSKKFTEQILERNRMLD